MVLEVEVSSKYRCSHHHDFAIVSFFGLTNAIMISIGDALALCTLAIKAYEAWDDAPREFSDVIDSLLQLERILHRVNNVAKDDESLLDIEELSLYLRPPCETLSELNSIVEQYREMRSWNRINLACRDLGPIRTRLSQNYTTLNTYLTIIGVGSLTKMQPTLSRMELQSQDMYAIMTELNSGVKGLKRSGTVMSRYEGDNTGIWVSKQVIFESDRVGRLLTLQTY